MAKILDNTEISICTVPALRHRVAKTRIAKSGGLSAIYDALAKRMARLNKAGTTAQISISLQRNRNPATCKKRTEIPAPREEASFFAAQLELRRARA